MLPLSGIPTYSFRIRERNNKAWIYDIFRKKFVMFTPEEWVRQNFLTWLTLEKGYPVSMLGVETNLQMEGTLWRCDAVFFNRSAKPHVIIECKSPDVQITQESFDQVARYNYLLRARYLMVTNGLTHYCCQVDYLRHTYQFLKEIPLWKDINSSGSY